MDLQLAGKRVFVSGSTQGIGYAVAVVCAEEGASVVLNGRTGTKVDHAVARLREAVPGVDASGIAADFAEPTQVQQLLLELGPVDVLVNNVGLFDVKPFGEVSDEEWLSYFDVNVMSAVRLSRKLLGGMLDRGWGRIVFVGTESAVDVPGSMVHYGATKAAGLAMSNGLAKLTKGTAVTVNTVLGGPTYSEGVADSIQKIASGQGISADDLKASLVREGSLIQRFIEPREIADVVAFLASPRSSATNGAAIRADGGVLPTLV